MGAVYYLVTALINSYHAEWLDSVGHGMHGTDA